MMNDFIVKIMMLTVMVLFICRSDRLVGLVVNVSTSGAEDMGFESRLCWDFSGLSHTSDLKIGTPVAVLPGAWSYTSYIDSAVTC